MAVSTLDRVEVPGEDPGRGAQHPGPSASPVPRKVPNRTIQRAIPVGFGLLGAAVYAIGRTTRNDFTGGIIEFLEWAVFGALIVGIAALVVSNLIRSGQATSIARGVLISVVVVALSWFIIDNAVDMDRLASTIRVVAIAIAVVGGLWISLNQIFNLATISWPAFMTVTGGGLAAIGFAILRGNRALRSLVLAEDTAELGAGAGLAGRLEWPIFGFVVFGVAFFAMSMFSSRPLRMVIGGAVGAITGFLIAGNMQVWQRPDLNWIAIVISVAVGVGVFVGLAALVKSPNLPVFAPFGAIAGFVFGAWLASPWHTQVTDAALNDARIGSIIPLSLLGAAIGFFNRPTTGQITRMDSRARAVIFLGPALLFLLAALVIPAIGTIVLSFGNRSGDAFVGLDNYRTLLGDDRTFDLSNWSSFFTSQLFYVGVALLLTGMLIGVTTGKRRDNEISFVGTGGSIGSIAIGVMLLAFAALSVLRGTFFNNLWWVITVTTMSTVIGLTIAVLAERAGRLESAVKSLIFMPMAVSFVGASIVWRLQYQPRDVSNEQTGVLNASWIALGKLARAGQPGNTYPAVARFIALGVLAAIVVGIVLSGIKRFQRRESLTGHSAGFVVFGYLLVELLRRSLGGFGIEADGTIIPETVVFLQDPRPFNNLYLMVILIWIQTGFAMVILAAAIKAVPQEFIEAAKVDGATEGQTFFRVILPQILPTLGVVVTTLIVLVTKVFDIVAVSTGGNFGTNVLANDMIDQSFSFFNRGLGAAIAVFILISVLPVMLLNVRRMQQARLG